MMQRDKSVRPDLHTLTKEEFEEKDFFINFTHSSEAKNETKDYNNNFIA
jgi:hypothetical protein